MPSNKKTWKWNVNGGVGDYSRWFCGHYIQGHGWEKYMDLKLGLVQKEDEEVKEGVGLSRE